MSLGRILLVTYVGVTLCGPQLVSAQPRYRIIDLTEKAEPFGVVQSEARGVNEAGQVVGFEVLPEYLARGIYWDADGSPAFLDPLPGDNTTIANHITESGVILGQSVKVTVEQHGHQIRIIMDQKAARWREGQVININDEVREGGDLVKLHFAMDADDRDRIVGFSGLRQGPPFDSNGFLFDDGVVTDLETLQRPVAINNRNQIVGYTMGQAKAYLWDDGNLINLHNHPNIGGVTTRAYDINDDGWIVGEAQFHISKPEEPALWRDGVPTRLVPDVNRPQGIAFAVNNAGQIVGFYNDLDDLNSPWVGALWENGERLKLLDLIPPELGWEVLFPFDISENGTIVGGGFRNGRVGRAFIMVPVGGCAGGERIAKARCRPGRGGNQLTVLLKGGVARAAFTVQLAEGPSKEGTLNDQGKGKVKFRDVQAGPGTATARWTCGAEDRKGYDCR